MACLKLVGVKTLHDYIFVLSSVLQMLGCQYNPYFICSFAADQSRPSYERDVNSPDWAPCLLLENTYVTNSACDRTRRRVKFVPTFKGRRRNQTMSTIENKDVVEEPNVEDMVADGVELVTFPGENNSECNITSQSEGVYEIHDNIRLVPNLEISSHHFEESNLQQLDFVELKKVIMELQNRNSELVSKVKILNANIVEKQKDLYSHCIEDEELMVYYTRFTPTAFESIFQGHITLVSLTCLFGLTFVDKLYRTTFINGMDFLNTTAIWDCFEIQIDTPHTPTDQVASFSSYKQRTTAKYLISVTPQGSVNFVSDGFLLENKGFPLEEVVASRGAKFMVPAFMKDRIHVERVIGVTRGRFKMLKGPIDRNFLNLVNESMSFVGKIVKMFSKCFHRIPILKRTVSFLKTPSKIYDNVSQGKTDLRIQQ
ncbi:Uncharacterized protein APZ42_021950 [Daphnia magna]|uniref:DDE Tnp4 domain-containing protein n=1 Tax=Daphnia magna TaxID=35525 RepID=A0A164W7C2_9CRUS|nr:Uncharacterized protein APZ42_021950 [Daphnia magna]